MAVIQGTDAGETLIGTDEADHISGLAGNDTIDGRAGADRMYGGTGNDIYYVDRPDDVVFENEGEGFDTVYAYASYRLRAAQHVEVLAAVDRTAETEMNLFGNEFANRLYGNAGSNLLNGGAGADLMDGGAGDDTYYVDRPDDVVIENEGGGYDVVYAHASYRLAAGQHIEALSAANHADTTAINLYGNEFANRIYGNAGSNLINGGGGADVMIGLGGDDTYYVDRPDDVVLEGVGGGYDVVYAQVSYRLAAGQHIEALSASNHGATTYIELYGNELGNLIYGNAGANLIDGGAGADMMIGLGGDDTYYVDRPDDIVIEGEGGGFDVVYAYVNYRLAAGQHIEALSASNHGATTYIELYGNELGNLIYGNSGANLIDGGAGADMMIGLGGDDTYYVDRPEDIVIEGEGGGFDVVYAHASYALSAGQHVEHLSASSHFAPIAMDLTGNELAQTVHGNFGDNVLDGKGGSDLLVGLGGSDSFAFTTALGPDNIDRIADFAPGTDRILLGGFGGQPFAALASGALAARSFVIGAAAVDGDDYLIYDSATGALLYDADGVGGAAAVQFAILQPGLNLTAADFAVSGPANNAPVVTSGNSATIAENSPPSTIVYQTVASDPDGDRITYSLAGQDAALFNIDATGAVRLNQSADYETRTSYGLTVLVSDSGTTTTRTLIVNVTDVADSAATPIIAEAEPNNSVGTAQAIDRAGFVVADNANLTDDGLPSATIQGNLPTTTDKDFFAVTLKAGELLILDVDNSSGNLDTHMRIYNSNGVEIGDNDDTGAIDPGSDPHPQYGHNTDSFIRFRAPEAGTYYFSIESFQDAQNPTTGTYDLHVSIGPPATLAELIDEDIEAMISGFRWNQTNLTYSFPTLASHYPPNTSETQDGFAPFTTTQQNAVTAQLNMISQVTGLTFQQLAPGPANLRYAMSSEPDVAYAYYPGQTLGGTSWFNNGPNGNRFANPLPGNYAWMGILHETGHALGLKHGHEAPAISFDRDTVEYTVMTYRSYRGASVGDDGGYTNEFGGYPQTLMMYDIAALQRMYGANYNHNAGDTVYSWNPSNGQMSVNGTTQWLPASNRIFSTIWDGGGTDTYDLSNYTPTLNGSTGMTIDLRPGEWSTFSAAQLAGLGAGNFARGNVANALLHEDNPASLIENAVGSQLDDSIIANQAANRLTGNGGADTFRWVVETDAGPGALADTITDFLRGTDKIDLSQIDAVPGTPANDAFAFVGTAAFSNTAGQLRYQVEGGDVRVQADLDGNGVADMEIVVSNLTILTATDFIL